jgi:TP901 family phage tail tape measure protein
MTSAGGRIEIEVVPDLSMFPSKLQSGLKSASGLASTIGRGLGLAVAGGAAVAAVGLAKAVQIGIEYTNQLNTLQSVTQATGVQMAQVGNLAKQLGADMTLPATSAADAAAAMTELAKGGLSVEQAMTAAKGTLQLAAAAQIGAAQAAEIQSDALNQFGLSADQAGHVADLLANAANSASGEITDMASSLKFVGPVARSVGENIDNVTTAIALLAVNGIRGEQAGTSLRGMIASLSAPSGPASKALETLGIKAFDATGKFVGLRSITEQLAAAKGRLSDAAFAEAAAVAFGNEGLTTATSLASSGAKAFEDMSVAVTRAGGAADVASAKTKGLGGAWEGFKSQLETTGIEIFEAIDAPLEALVRSSANFVAEYGDNVARGLETAIAAAEVFGDRIGQSIRSRTNVIGDAVNDVFGPIVSSTGGVLNEGLNTAIELWDDFTEVLRRAVDAAKPVSRGIADIVRASTEAGGPVSALGAGVGILGDAARIAAGVLVPLGAVVGGIASAFAALPGPIQSAALALGLVAAFRSRLTGIGDAVRDNVTSRFQSLNEQIRLQQALLTGSTQIASQQVGRLGLAFAALQSNVPVIGRMAESFRNASETARSFVAQQSVLVQGASGISGQYTGLASVLGKSEGALRGLAGAAAGATAALGTGLKSAASGLVSAFGGPWGAALAVAGVGLSVLASHQQEAARRTQEHASYVDGLGQALRESNGVVNEAVRSRQALSLQSAKIADTEQSVADAAREAGISLDDLTEATLGNGEALEELRSRLAAVIASSRVISEGDLMGGSGTVEVLNEQGQAAQKLLDEVNRLAGGFDKAQRDQKELDNAIRSGTARFSEATSAGRDLSSAMGILSSNTADADSRARALKSALDALSGGEISLEAAQSRVQESLSRINQLFGENLDKTKGWGKELLNAQGGLNLTTENGRRLRDTLQDLTTNTAEVASKTFDMARAQGDDLPTAVSKARDAMQQSRDAFISTATSMGITSKEAEILADRAGLIPDNAAIAISTPGSDQTKIELALVKGLVDRVPPDKPITVRSLSDEAKRKLEELGFTVRTLPDGRVEITANTNPAKQQLDSYIASNSNRTITVRVNTVGVPISVPGQFGAALNARGNLIEAFASGGFHRLNPMKGGLAQIVQPNTWRVIGDRVKDPEAYIPINQSARSVSLLDETARRMGYALARRYANGGIATTGAAQSSMSVISSNGEFRGQLVLDSGEYLGTVRGVVRQEMDAESREVRYRGGRP